MASGALTGDGDKQVSFQGPSLSMTFLFIPSAGDERAYTSIRVSVLVQSGSKELKDRISNFTKLYHLMNNLKFPVEGLNKNNKMLTVPSESENPKSVYCSFPVMTRKRIPLALALLICSMTVYFMWISNNSQLSLYEGLQSSAYNVIAQINQVSKI